jgi:hypothetical protein
VTADSPLPGLRGAIVWAIVAYIPQAPARLWQGTGRPPATLPDALSYAQQVRERELSAQQTFLVEGQLRPMLLLQERPRGVLDEIVALSLVYLSKLSERQQARIREQREHSVFHLPLRPGKYGMNREMAVDLNALSRIHVSAMLPRPVGRLDDNEMRVINERLVEHLDIDFEPLLSRLVERRVERLTQSVRGA